MKHCKLSVSENWALLPEPVTRCATVDEAGDEHVVTEFMIRRACEQMDAAQIWPYVDKTVAATLRSIPVGNTATIIPFTPRLN